MASFGKKNIADTRLPLRIAIQEKEGARPVILQQGSIASVLRVALARNGFFTPVSWDGAPATAATTGAALIALSDEARAGGGSPVIVIDTGETPVDPVTFPADDVLNVTFSRGSRASRQPCSTVTGKDRT